MNFRDRLAAKFPENNLQPVPPTIPVPEAQPELFEIPDKSQFFGIENVRSHPACLDLRLADGSFIAFPYAYFVELNYSPSDGIHILSSTKKICITGRNLQELYSYLISYRIKFVQANIGNDLTESQTLFVKDIQIEEI